MASASPSTWRRYSGWRVPTPALPSTEEKPSSADDAAKQKGILVGAGLALGLVLGKVLRI